MRTEYLSREKEILFEIKKGKFKTKILLARYTKAFSTISRANLKYRKYVFTITWKVAVTVSISEND